MPRPQHLDPSQALLSFHGFGSHNHGAASVNATGPKIRNTNLVVHISERPPSSRPASEPFQPISLLPSRFDAYGLDTGAFIVDKLVTPLDGEATAADSFDTNEKDAWYAANPQQQRVRQMLCYVVGWPDEPYARQLVRCTEILDYVSPRTLEDWEYARMEERRARMMARNELSENRDRGSSSKRELGSPTETVAALARNVTAAGKATARKAAARDASARSSISTTPTRIKQSLPTDKRPSRPARSPAVQPSLSSLQIRLDSPPLATRALAPVEVASPSPAALPALLCSPSSDGQNPAFSLKRSFQKFNEDRQDVDTTLMTKGSYNDEDVEFKVPVSDHSEKEEEDGEDEDELHRDSFHPGHPMLAPPLQTTPAVYRRLSHQAPHPALSPTPYKKARDTDSAVHNSSTHPASLASAVYTSSPQIARKWQSHVQLKAPPQQEEITPKMRRALGENITPSSPVLKSRQQTPQSSLPYLSPLGPPQKEVREVVEERPEDLYEVDRLLDDCLAAVGENFIGNDKGLTANADPKVVAAAGSHLVRYFLVRWKGDWPPDQNPTWEPAENLPPRMIRQYLKKATRKRADKHKNGIYHT
ncbi:hypothetical protein SEPCBS57363_003387 [Sporothrix epigloea]|uniref:Chromo domain-containing protein n=1 Tax=Sporothrix epigloea TaxID=1892477 RepID=A0ABP0DL75_9PEZI